ncbi:hemerythrin domain-containing protein [Kocuria sp. NPDC057446]|uniref:hemerythrin domain-containing protein n=1 Tax=Kocuria sp. NPDC057446 TaxID=3346137 RepID=UPI0036D1DA55
MMRSIAEQKVDELGGRLSVLTRQRRDHVKLEDLLEDLAGTTGAAQGQVLLRIYRLVFPHAFAEESVLWPMMRRVLPDGHELTLEVEREHQEVNELVTALEALEADDPAREPVLARLVEVLREDVRDEEDVLLPRLQAILSRARLRGLGLAWEVVRRTAPTRAHPVVARRPPGNVVAAVPLSVLDRVRDLVDGAVLRGPERVGPGLRRVSAGLAGLAHRVEHLPVMRRGEDPSTRPTGH